MVDDRRREAGCAAAAAGSRPCAGLRHSAVSTCRSLNAALVSLEMKNGFPLKERHLSTQGLLQNRWLCRLVWAQLYSLLQVSLGHPCATDRDAVGAGPCVLVLHAHGRATPQRAWGNADAGSKAGNAQAPNMRLRYSHISEPWESKTMMSMQTCSGLSVSGHCSGQTGGNICLWTTHSCFNIRHFGNTHVLNKTKNISNL